MGARAHLPGAHTGADGTSRCSNYPSVAFRHCLGNAHGPGDAYDLHFDQVADRAIDLGRTAAAGSGREELVVSLFGVFWMHVALGYLGSLETVLSVRFARRNRGQPRRKARS